MGSWCNLGVSVITVACQRPSTGQQRDTHPYLSLVCLHSRRQDEAYQRRYENEQTWDQLQEDEFGNLFVVSAPDPDPGSTHHQCHRRVFSSRPGVR